MAKDVLKDVIYAALVADPMINQQAGSRIKFYEYPDTGDVSGPYIIIDPLDVPSPEEYADNTWLTWDYIFQIDVWSRSRITTLDLSERLVEVMWAAGFRPYGGGYDEWDKETGIFRQARRFRGRLYKDSIK